MPTLTLVSIKKEAYRCQATSQLQDRTMPVAPSLSRDLKSEPPKAIESHVLAYQVIAVFTSTITTISLALTVYRLIYRYAMRRFWWEDACAAVALIGGVICVVTSWIHFELGKIIRPVSTSNSIDTSSWPTCRDLVLDICTHISWCGLVRCFLCLS